MGKKKEKHVRNEILIHIDPRSRRKRIDHRGPLEFSTIPE